MRRSLVGAAIFTLSAFAPVSQGKADLLPTEIGACSETTISDIGYRLGDPDSGSAISYANGGAQVSYDTIPEIHHSRVGGRTRESWEAPDSQHSCGGA
jgi:hypothetical protein